MPAVLLAVKRFGTFGNDLPAFQELFLYEGALLFKTLIARLLSLVDFDANVLALEAALAPALVNLAPEPATISGAIESD